MIREDFNGNWTFAKEGKESETVAVTLPHDAMIWEKRSENADTGTAGGFYPGGNYLYTKKFQIPEDAVGESWIVEFEGAYLDSYVFLNKCFVLSNHSGARGFVADLTPYLKYGEENVLEVKVRNDAQINARWYTGSGLYRPVWLYRGGDIRVDLSGIRIETPEVEPEVSKVQVTVPIYNRTNRTKTIRLNTLLKDMDGEVVCQENQPVTLFPQESPIIVQQLYLRDGKLWSTEEPNLYNCEVQLLDGDVVLDQTSEHFGLRHIQMDPVKGLRINGQKVLLRGSCIHQDHGILGAAEFYDAEERKVRLSKEAGFNALRIAHQSSSKALLDACDKYGMLLMEESFDQWVQQKNIHDYAERFEQEWEREVEAIVAKDYNHPCVFLYSIGNEITELGKKDGIRISRMLTNKFRELDASRAITNAINGGIMDPESMFRIFMEIGVFTPEQLMAIQHAAVESDETQETKDKAPEQGKKPDINDIMTILAAHMGKIVNHRLVTERLEEAMSHLDICGYNYMMARYAADIESYPNRIICGSETNPPKISELWSFPKKYPGCLGDFTWTGWDYIGEVGIGLTKYNEQKGFGGEYPVYLAYCGDMDITGYRMPISYLREIVFGLRKTPYVSVQDPIHFEDEPSNTPWAIPETLESWTWPGQEERMAKVYVFSPSEEVVLLCNDVEVGRAACGETTGYQAILNVKYEPGKLCAVGYTNGEEDGRFEICTASDELVIQTELSKTEIDADGSELSYLSIQLVDGRGVVHCEKEYQVTIATEGGIVLQGFGSANPYSTENFYDHCQTTYHGRLLAAIRGCDSGEAVVTVSVNDLKKTLKLNVK